MNKPEPHPLTSAMVHIATHTDNPWLKEYCDQHDPRPSEQKEKQTARQEPAFDAKDSLIKHLAGKVRVE